jgi:hypothetical protein
VEFEIINRAGLKLCVEMKCTSCCDNESRDGKDDGEELFVDFRVEEAAAAV